MPAAARDPEPGHLVQGSHSLQALGHGGLPKPGKNLTGEEGEVGLQTVDTGNPSPFHEIIFFILNLNFVYNNPICQEIRGKLCSASLKMFEP